MNSRRLASDLLRAVAPLLLLSLALAALGAEVSDAPGPSNAPVDAKTAARAEAQAAFEGAAKAAQKGPADIVLAGQAHLQLPPNFAFIPAAPSALLLKSAGNTVDAGFQGLVVPRLDDGSFSFYSISYAGSGYVKDDDARSWKADDLIDRLRKGTEEENKQRVERGFPQVEVVGWIEPPAYDPAKHQLVWSIAARDKGSQPGADDGVNYRTLVLGREGYLAMTLVTDKAHFDTLKPRTPVLLDAIRFDEGKRYADFNSTTDHVAEFGLAALVAGVAAKKLGLIALAAAFFIKFAKLIALAVAGAFFAVRKWLGLQKKGATADGAAPALPAVPETAAAMANEAAPEPPGAGTCAAEPAAGSQPLPPASGAT